MHREWRNKTGVEHAYLSSGIASKPLINKHNVRTVHAFVAAAGIARPWRPYRLSHRWDGFDAGLLSQSPLRLHDGGESCDATRKVQGCSGISAAPAPQDLHGIP